MVEVLEWRHLFTKYSRGSGKTDSLYNEASLRALLSRLLKGEVSLLRKSRQHCLNKDPEEKHRRKSRDLPVIKKGRTVSLLKGLHES